MPSDTLTIIVTTGIGISVFVGVFSGVCYVLVHSLPKRSSHRSLLQWDCAVCNKYLRYRIIEKAVICTKCHKRVCKYRCSQREHTQRGWICYNCLKTSSWFRQVFASLALRFRSEKSKQNIIATRRMNKDFIGKRDVEKDSVRDFIEKSVSKVLGENVDDASIFKIYNNKHYNLLFQNYHKELSDAITNLSTALQLSFGDNGESEETPSTAHSNLKHLLERLLRESLLIPRFNKTADQELTTDKRERTYEDLLATAILNKVVSRNQRNSSESGSSSKKTRSTDDDKEYFFGDETIEEKWQSWDGETTSSSSIEEYLQSDSSIESSKYVDRVSLTIRQKIEKTCSSDFEEEFGSDDINSQLLESEESNWYLQKPQFTNIHSPIPVPMLVPNPTTAAKVLIGDQEIDETSDLSDAATDNDYVDFTAGPQNLTFQSNFSSKETHNSSSDGEVSLDSGVRDDHDDPSEREEKLEIFNTESHITCDDYTRDIEHPPPSLHGDSKQNSGYDEKCRSLPRNINKKSSYLELAHQDHLHLLPKQDILQEATLMQEAPPFPVFEGRYSKREKEKWNNPINLPNNPYSKENIQKRIEANDRYGRDYYTRQASTPSGKARSDDEPDATKTIETYIPDQEPQEWYRATAVRTDEEEITDSTSTANTIYNHNIPDLTSDSDISLINFYDVENARIYQHDTDEIPRTSPAINDDGESSSNANDDYNPYHQDNINKPQTKYSVMVNTEGLLHYQDDLENKTELNFKGVKKENQQIQTSDNENEVSQINKIPISTPKTYREQSNPTKNNIVFSHVTSAVNSNINVANSPVAIVNKRSDNTWIKKIYSNPVVRSFALTNREQLPFEIPEPTKPNQTPNPTVTPPAAKEERLIEKEYPTRNENEEAHELKISERDGEIQIATNINFSLEFSETDSLPSNTSSNKNTDISELRELRVVANRLGQFSKSFPNLSKKFVDKAIRADPQMVHGNVIPQNDDGSDFPTENFVSVRDLKRLFETRDASSHRKDKPVHSLTARSISLSLKEKLKGNNDFDVGVRS